MMAAILEANEMLLQVSRAVHASGNEALTETVRKQIGHFKGNNLVFVMNPIGTLHLNLYPVALRPAPADIVLFSED